MKSRRAQAPNENFGRNVEASRALAWALHKGNQSPEPGLWTILPG